MAERLALIIDDSPTALAVLSRMLKRLQVSVDTVLSGEEALVYLEKNTPDIIFLDHIMPGMDGFEALRAIKNNGHTRGIPVVMYTSQKERKYAEEAKHLGAVDVISKQVTGGLLSRVLDHVWRGGKSANDTSHSGKLESLDDVVDQVNRSQVAADAEVAEEQEQRNLMGLKSSLQSHPVDHLLKHYLEVQRKEILTANDEMFKRFSSVYLADENRNAPPPARSSFLLTLVLVILSVVSTTVAVSLYQQMERQKREVHRTLVKIERENRRAVQAAIGKIDSIENQYEGALKDQASLITIIDRLSDSAEAESPDVVDDDADNIIDDTADDDESVENEDAIEPGSETVPDDIVDDSERIEVLIKAK